MAVLRAQGTDLLLVNSLGFLCMCLVYLRGKRRKTPGLAPIPWLRIFLFTACLMLPVALLTFFLIGNAFGSVKIITFLVNCTVSFGIVSVCEELLFREFLIVRLEALNAPLWLILLLPALLFSLCHRPESLSLLVQRFILAMGLAFLYRKSGLVISIAVHWVYNVIIYTFHSTLPYVAQWYGTPRAALYVLLCLFSVFIMVIVFYLNKSIFVRYT
jgi:membrane protease YdiL (CAAX protease family)